MNDRHIQKWVGREIQVDGIRWRIVEIGDPDPITAKSTVRYERVYDKVRETPPVIRDAPPIVKEAIDVSEL